MSGFLDTSIVVRYLTGDSPQLAEQAAEIIDRDENLKITDVAIVETAYVLTSVYEIEREVVVDNLITFMQKKNISPFALEKGLVLQALLLCRPSGRISFADAMIWAAVRSAGSKSIYSLDDRFPSDGIEILKEY
jgi:predicted nucleic-acid-binding protein